MKQKASYNAVGSKTCQTVAPVGNEIEALELKNLMQNDTIDLIDVRTPVEYKQGHILGARLHPLQNLNVEEIRTSRPEDAKGPTYILCKAGSRARKAAIELKKAEINCCVVTGGTEACLDASFPSQSDASCKVISLERQVRIASGSLILAAAILSYLVNISFVGISAFVGAGLVFAGVTDTCGMGMFLAKMPWNR